MTRGGFGGAVGGDASAHPEGAMQQGTGPFKLPLFCEPSGSMLPQRWVRNPSET